jgi:hypothetical protein
VRWESRVVVETEASVAEVWAAIVDGRRWSFWHDGFEWMWIEGPLEPGSTLTLKPRRYRQTAFVLEEIVAERRFVFATSFGPVARVRVAFDVEPLARGTRIAYAVVADGVLGGLGVRMIGRRLADGAEAALARLGKEEAR